MGININVRLLEKPFEIISTDFFIFDIFSKQLSFRNIERCILNAHPTKQLVSERFIDDHFRKIQ